MDLLVLRPRRIRLWRKKPSLFSTLLQKSYNSIEELYLFQNEHLPKASQRCNDNPFVLGFCPFWWSCSSLGFSLVRARSSCRRYFHHCPTACNERPMPAN